MDLPVLTTPGNKPNCPACFGSVFGRVGIAAVCHKCGHHFHANCLPDLKCSNCKAPNTLDYFGVQGFFDGKAQIITFGVNKTVATIDEIELVSNQFYEEAARSTRCANLLFPKKDKMKQGHEMMDSFLTSPQLNKATLPSLPPSPELDRKPAAKPVAPKKKVLVRTPATSHNWNMLRNGRVPVNYKESSSSGSSNDTSKDTTSKKRTTSMMEDMDYQPSSSSSSSSDAAAYWQERCIDLFGYSSSEEEEDDDLPSVELGPPIKKQRCDDVPAPIFVDASLVEVVEGLSLSDDEDSEGDGEWLPDASDSE